MYVITDPVSTGVTTASKVINISSRMPQSAIVNLKANSDALAGSIGNAVNNAATAITQGFDIIKWFTDNWKLVAIGAIALIAIIRR